MSIETNKTYKIRSAISSTRMLNLYSSGTAANGMNVVLYTSDDSNEQKWLFDGDRLRPKTDTTFCLDRYTASTYLNNADIWKASASDAAAQKIELEAYGIYYYIRLQTKVDGKDYYLTASNNTNGNATAAGKQAGADGNVYWAEQLNGGGDYHQLWFFTEDSGSSSGGETSGNYCWPTESKVISNGYSSDHDGIDITPLVSQTPGDEVYAYMDGSVSFVGTPDTNPNEGYTVRIHHNNPLKSQNGYARIRTQYMHLDSTPLVNKFDEIHAGDLIGYMGNTGHVESETGSTAPGAGTHLHFEVRGGSESDFALGGSSRYATGTVISPMPYLNLT